MGEKNNDGGQFFTPREVIRPMIEVLDPRVGETVYDPGCGTGGFLAEAYRHMRAALDAANGTTDDYEQLAERTFYGREKESLIYPIALANLVLHGIDHPHIWFGNTLTGGEVFGALFAGAPRTFKVIATNPPFGGKEGKEAQDRFDYKTGSTQVLFLQHVMKMLDPEDGRCGIVVDEGLLFRTNETAFVKTKRKLLEEFDLWCIVSLPGGVFTQAGAGVKTNLLFFRSGQPTERIWYYDLSELKVAKRKPLTRAHFDELKRLLPERADSDHSWTVDLNARRADLKAKAQPYRDQALGKRREAAPFGERLRALMAFPRKDQDHDAIAAADAQFKALTKEARALDAKADDIENQLYDLKAVNPNKKSDSDTRTPQELLDLIAAKGREIAEVLAELRGPVGLVQPAVSQHPEVQADEQAVGRGR
jgi:type I restriction enzyme M protein